MKKYKIIIACEIVLIVIFVVFITFFWQVTRGSNTVNKLANSWAAKEVLQNMSPEKDIIIDLARSGKQLINAHKSSYESAIPETNEQLLKILGNCFDQIKKTREQELGLMKDLHEMPSAPTMDVDKE